MKHARWDRLVVGGGRAVDFPELKAGDLSLNIDADARPHVLADIAQAPFESAHFAEVYFEKVPFDAFTGKQRHAIKEVARLLAGGGRLVIETGHLVPVEDLRTSLREAGFRLIRFTYKGFVRISAWKAR